MFQYRSLSQYQRKEKHNSSEFLTAQQTDRTASKWNTKEETNTSRVDEAYKTEQENTYVMFLNACKQFSLHQNPN